MDLRYVDGFLSATFRLVDCESFKVVELCIALTADALRRSLRTHGAVVAGIAFAFITGDIISIFLFGNLVCLAFGVLYLAILIAITAAVFVAV